MPRMSPRDQAKEGLSTQEGQEAQGGQRVSWPNGQPQGRRVQRLQSLQCWLNMFLCGYQTP